MGFDERNRHLDTASRRNEHRHPVVLSTRFRTLLLLGALILGVAGVGALQIEAAAAHASSQDRSVIHFQREVMPILAEHCLLCHGPDEEAGGLRLDQAEGMARVVVAGSADASELLERILTKDDDLRMPFGKPPLAEKEIAILRNWIDQGAEWPQGAGHWAFARPERSSLPEVDRPGWARGQIDRFILQRLEENGLAPSPAANQETLIRRLHLDLVGLPPEPDAIDHFLADTAPDAYERLVEQLLASPHYGERWGLRWLDLARYGDTDGYDYDRVRPAWPYREWVIAALNRDQPYDRFVIEQIAGDLLADANDDQRIATGFIRNSPVPQYRFDAMVDRVATLGTAILGLSLECAQCHNHKFDPITQLEFYRIMAVFNNAEDRTEKVHSSISGELTDTLVVAERSHPTETFLAVGGSFLDPGERAMPGTLAAFHVSNEREDFNRLHLAEWLVDERNPLVARVAVNRQWEAFFGRALVPTSEDLGTRTARPSHPELLDWLAVEFQESGWSLKQLHRTIVLSETYRQSSSRTREAHDADPENRWLGRGARFRVEAELIRDIALTAAGSLHERLGGPSVFTPQPPGISENRLRGAMAWRTSEKGDRYRRGIYTFWKRAALHPGLALFDAPRREDSCPRRGRSNSPLQALVTLNEPAFVEAAVLLGKRMWESDPETNDPETGIRLGFRLCTSRWPTKWEEGRLRQFYRAEAERFAANPEAARAFVSAVANPDLMGIPRINTDDDSELVHWAACSMVANVLLSLDETMTRP